LEGKVIAVTAACRGCGACLLTCPERAIRPAARDAGPLTVLEYRCTGCGECVEVCPVDAIEFTGDPMIAASFWHIRPNTHHDHEFAGASAFEVVRCVSSEAKGEGETA
jgi:Pyruvate/2-oxoacid:ferredoxin oxidoreductase delta subunit